MPTIPQCSVAELVEEYRQSLAGSTRLAYGGDIREFVRAVGPGSVLNATSEMLAAYILGLRFEAKASRATSALRSFYRWLAQNDHVVKDPTVYLRFKAIWALRERPDTHMALVREGFTRGEISILRWRDFLHALLMHQGKRLRVGKRTRAIRATLRRDLVQAFDEAIRSEGIEAVIGSPIVPRLRTRRVRRRA